MVVLRVQSDADLGLYIWVPQELSGELLAYFDEIRFPYRMNPKGARDVEESRPDLEMFVFGDRVRAEDVIEHLEFVFDEIAQVVYLTEVENEQGTDA